MGRSPRLVQRRLWNFAMMESILNGTQLDQAEPTRAFGLGTALVATSLDLWVDPFMLDLLVGVGSKGQTVGTVSRC